MKALTRTLGLFILSIFVFNNTMAQKANFTTNGGMTIGFGGGMAYQKSDLTNSNGFGFDFVLGSQLYYKENAFLSVDWKFRFLAGENKAYDHRINPDNTFSNIRYSFFSYDLEVGLTLNRLRERTRIIVTGFAGAGITHGRTFTDLYDTGNNLYDFSSIDPNRDSKLVYNDLRTLSDGNFETRLINKAAILPTAGIFIGYQLSRSFSVGIEFKTNFYLTEKNSIVGINLDNRDIAGSSLDRNNYVSLGFKWNLRGGSSYNNAVNNYSHVGTNNNRNNMVNTLPNPNANETNNPVLPVSLPRPSVNITNPSADSYHTVSHTHTIKATVNNVSGPDNISFYQNGIPNNFFTYNVTTKILSANVSLRDGENNIRIKATNQTATAEDLVMITLDRPLEAVKPLEAAKPAPTVRFTSPSANRVTSTADRINVTASVKNISSKQDIQFTLNGSNTSFEYNPVSGLVKTSVMLTNGDNKLLIKGSNESGSAQDQLTVYFNNPEEIAIPPSNTYNQPVIVPSTTYNQPVIVPSTTYNTPVVRSSPPVINIIKPMTDPVRTLEHSEELRATVLNVNTKENITLNINGINTRSFDFNNRTKVLTTRVALRDGQNVLTISAKNESGGDVKDQVFFKETRPCPLPVVRLIDPAQGQTNTNQQIYAVRAEVRNIANTNQLRLTVNGKPVSFSFSNNLVSSSVPLISGLNTLSLNARNECGEDNASARITSNHSVAIVPIVPCTPPKVSFTVNEVNRNNPTDGRRGSITSAKNKANISTHELRGSISSVKNKADISITVNGRANHGFQFVPATGVLSAKFKLTPGSHRIVVTVNNACGTDSKNVTVNVEEPCSPPKVSFTVNEVNRADATHELKGSISGVNNKADISLTVNGRADHGFQFVPATGVLSAKFKLTPGSHRIVVTVKNACGTDTKSESLSIEEEACGIRINPGNSAWQFCLVTPSGTFSRDNLTNSNFSYSGPATSLYIMPIGNGGDATVNGKPYPIRSGQYYLFTGSLNVTVSTKNPGSMGHWSVCISANRQPVSGNGNNRPKSPCEVEKDRPPKGNGNKR